MAFQTTQLRSLLFNIEMGWVMNRILYSYFKGHLSISEKEKNSPGMLDRGG
jgi:hypothetical protein